MSHFTVLVVGPNPEEQLAPYHEFECTGDDNKFVQDVDKTEEIRADYESDTRRMMLGPNGELENTYNRRFYREPTEDEKPHMGMGHGFGNGLSWSSQDWGDGKGYRTLVAYVPEGWQEVQKPFVELMTFLEYCTEYEGYAALKKGDSPTEEHKYGYVLANMGEVIKVVRRTNPNAKWDWYQLGGRWTGFFKMKEGTPGMAGSPGLMTEFAKSGYADSAVVKDIDFEGMFAEARQKAKDEYGLLKKLFKDQNWLTKDGELPKLKHTWASIIADDPKFKDLDLEDKRALYHGSDLIQKVNSLSQKSFNDNSAFSEKEKQLIRTLSWNADEYLSVSEEDFVSTREAQAVSCYAVLKDGEWFSKGEMGFWGMSRDSKSEDEWRAQVRDMLGSLPEDTLLSLYDCHT